MKFEDNYIQDLKKEVNVVVSTSAKKVKKKSLKIFAVNQTKQKSFLQNVETISEKDEEVSPREEMLPVEKEDLLQTYQNQVENPTQEPERNEPDVY